jgi:hypothetical protein
MELQEWGEVDVEGEEKTPATATNTTPYTSRHTSSPIFFLLYAASSSAAQSSLPPRAC